MKENNKKINLLVLNDNGIIGGGAENRLKLLLNSFRNEEFICKIIVLQKYGSDLSDGKIKIITCRNILGSLILFYKLIKKEKINIIQAHNISELTPILFIVAKIMHIPTIFFAHDYWPICGYRSFINPYTASSKKLCNHPGKIFSQCLSFKSSIKLRIWRALLNLANVGVASGETVKKVYEENKMLRNKWEIITPWIDTKLFGSSTRQRKKEKSKIILFVGSLAEFKGAWVLAEALKFVKKEFPDIKAVFIGSRQEKNSADRIKLENIGKRDNTINNMLFLEEQNWQFIKKMHEKSAVYACPTICMETFGLNWAEAMASGVPIVASRIGSIPDFLEKRGILVEPRNPISLAEGILKLLKNKKLAKTRSEDGKKYALSNFTVEVANKSILRLYHSLLQKPSSN